MSTAVFFSGVCLFGANNRESDETGVGGHLFVEKTWISEHWLSCQHRTKLETHTFKSIPEKNNENSGLLCWPFLCTGLCAGHVTWAVTLLSTSSPLNRCGCRARGGAGVRGPGPEPPGLLVLTGQVQVGFFQSFRESLRHSSVVLWFNFSIIWHSWIIIGLFCL